MKIVKTKSVEPLILGQEAIQELYPDGYDSLNDRNLLTDIINVFSKQDVPLKEGFNCFVEDTAFDAFLSFANKVHKETGNESCGIFVGYYLQPRNSSNTKIIVATRFLEAHGPASRVTCEISFEDNISYFNYCDEHRVLPLIWIHSHPGFGVFYSGTDSETLARCYYAPHQMGIVVDNLQNQVMGFKIYDGKECNEDIFTFNLQDNLSSERFISNNLYKKNKIKITPVASNESKKKILDTTEGNKSKSEDDKLIVTLSNIADCMDSVNSNYREIIKDRSRITELENRIHTLIEYTSSYHNRLRNILKVNVLLNALTIIILIVLAFNLWK